MTKPRKAATTGVVATAARKRAAAPSQHGAAKLLPQDLLSDVRHLIDGARRSAALAVNAGLTLMYWRIGQRIRTEVLGNQRADYGQQIVATLSRQLVAD